MARKPFSLGLVGFAPGRFRCSPDSFGTGSGVQIRVHATFLEAIARLVFSAAHQSDEPGPHGIVTDAVDTDSLHNFAPLSVSG
jgi:hypothetical protein